MELSAYFLSKYAMTQGQWQRVTGENPSYHQPPSELAHTLLHPVEQVSWFQCLELMERLDLALPSEGQWERGARGGTWTPWWTGEDRESLRGKANLADQAAHRAGVRWDGIDDWPDLDDGWVVHAPVGTFPANPFGLHEVAGNLAEWCLDGFDHAAYRRTGARDPVVPWEGSRPRILRGGTFIRSATDARSSFRGDNSPDIRVSLLGLRPARGIIP